MTGAEEQLGDKVDPKAEQARLRSIKEAKATPGPTRAERGAERAVERVDVNVERLEALGDRPRALARAKARGEQLRAERAAMADPTTAKPGMTVVPDASRDENLRPRPSSAAAVQEFTERARASQSAGANQDRTDSGAALVSPGNRPAEFRTEPMNRVPGGGRVATRPEATSELRPEALRDERMARRPAGVPTEAEKAERLQKDTRAYAQRAAEEAATQARLNQTIDRLEPDAVHQPATAEAPSTSPGLSPEDAQRAQREAYLRARRAGAERAAAQEASTR